MNYDVKNINTGDCFGYSGVSIQANIIQKFQALVDKESAYINHTGIFVWINGTLYICEATEWKNKKMRALVLLTPYKDYFLRKGSLYHFKYKKNIKEKLMSKCIISTVGIPYEYGNLIVHQIVRTVTNKMFGKGWWIGKEDAEKVICHENTQNIWNNYSGIFPKFYKGDIARLYYNENFELLQINK